MFQRLDSLRLGRQRGAVPVRLCTRERAGRVVGADSGRRVRRGADAALREGLGADLEQQLLVAPVEFQDGAVAEMAGEGLLAHVEPGVALVVDLVGERQRQAQAAEIVEGRDGALLG